MRVPEEIDVNTVSDLNKATALAATGQSQAAATSRIKLLSDGFCIDHRDSEPTRSLFDLIRSPARREAVRGHSLA